MDNRMLEIFHPEYAHYGYDNYADYALGPDYTRYVFDRRLVRITNRRIERAVFERLIGQRIQETPVDVRQLKTDKKTIRVIVTRIIHPENAAPKVETLSSEQIIKQAREVSQKREQSRKKVELAEKEKLVRIEKEGKIKEPKKDQAPDQKQKSKDKKSKEKDKDKDKEERDTKE